LKQEFKYRFCIFLIKIYSLVYRNFDL